MHDLSLGQEWSAVPAWYQYRDPFDEFFEEWFVQQFTWAVQNGFAVETEWGLLGWRIRVRGKTPVP
jgi:hypothetical protein